MWIIQEQRESPFFARSKREIGNPKRLFLERKPERVCVFTSQGLTKGTLWENIKAAFGKIMQ